MPDPTAWDTAGSIANVITAGAAAFAAWHAWRGLSAWRDEMIGRRKTELAEDVLSGFYQAADTIRAIRSPMSFPKSESEGRPRSDGETQQQKEALDSHYVPIARIEKRREFFGDLMAKRYRMKALFGEKVDAPFDAIHKTVHEIQVTASLMMRSAKSQQQVKQETWDRWETIIWEGIEEEDKITGRVSNAVKQIEGICGSLLEARR